MPSKTMLARIREIYQAIPGHLTTSQRKTLLIYGRNRKRSCTGKGSMPMQDYRQQVSSQFRGDKHLITGLLQDLRTADLPRVHLEGNCLTNQKHRVTYLLCHLAIQ